LKNILSRARSTMRGLVANHPDAIPLAASAVRFATMVAEGTIGAGRPAIISACAAINLTVDYLVQRLSR